MTDLFRVRTALTGFAGAPGVATMYFLDIATAVDSVHTLWTAFALDMPTDVHIQVEGFGDVINDATGDLVRSWTGETPGEIIGNDPDRYAAPVGILARWSTDTVIDSHRLRGRTFIVPATNTNFTVAGQVSAGSITNLQTAMIAFRTAQSSSFVVWHRPKFGPRTAPGVPRPIIRNGNHGLVTGIGVSSKPVVLRSRRD